MSEFEKTVVLGIITKFGTNVANFDTFKWMVVLEAADLDKYSLNTIIVLSN